MKRTHDLAVSVDSYEKDGQRKSKWMNVGVILSDGERTVIKLEGLPINQTNKEGQKEPWGGWIQAFPIQQEQPRPAPAQAPADDIPF